MQQPDHYKATLYQWHQLIQEASDYSSIWLEPEIESYLLLTLVQYIQNDHLAEEAIAMALPTHILSAEKFSTDMLSNESKVVVKNHKQQLKVRADHSLILAGLFPAHIDRQSIRISQYIKIGMNSYSELSYLLEGNDSQIYQKLADSFIKLVDILHTIRAFTGSPAIPLMQAMELWSDTGSKSAYQILTMNRQSIPLNESLLGSSYKH